MKRLMLSALLALAAPGVVVSAGALYDPVSRMFVPTPVSARHELGATLQHSSATATGAQHAHVIVDLPDTSVTRSDSASIEVVVRPETLSAGEPYIVLVYAKTNEGGQAVAEYSEFLGSFAWHVPPQLGQLSTFYVNAPDHPSVTDDGYSMDIEIRLEPIEGEALRHSSLTVLRATMVP